MHKNKPLAIYTFHTFQIFSDWGNGGTGVRKSILTRLFVFGGFIFYIMVRFFEWLVIATTAVEWVGDRVMKAKVAIYGPVSKGEPGLLGSLR